MAVATINTGDKYGFNRDARREARSIRECLKNNCLNVYVNAFTPTRVVDVRVRNGQLEGRTLSGKWISMPSWYQG